VRIIKPQRISVLQRAFEVRGDKLLALGLTAYVPFSAPELALPEISMWQELPKQAGKDVIVDEGLPKPRGEVLCFGKVFAPGGKARAVVQPRVRVGSVDKSLYAIGERRWVRGVATDPEPFTELPLGWDKSFGGDGFVHNPLGKGALPIEQDGAMVHPLPQLEDPKALVKSPNDKPRPAGFGPLDSSWPTRHGKLGTYDAKWLETDFPGFARDLDPEFFMIAPEDQRLPDFFQGGEPITVENLHPDEPKIEGRVTSLLARCFVTKRTAEGEVFEEVPTRLDTLILLPNVARAVAIFRGVVRVSESDGSDVTCLLAGLERRGEPRGLSHYRKVLEQRLDKKKGHLVALRDRDLLPDPDPDAPKLADEKISDMEDLLEREGVMEKRGHARAQRELDEARKAALVLGVDPDAKGIPREVPPPEKPPQPDELAEYIERVEQEAARVEAEAKEKEKEGLEEARKLLAERGIDLDEAIEKAKKEGGGPPKFRAEAHLEQMRETARAGRALGAPMEEFEAQIEDPAFAEKLRKMEEGQLLGYRLAAHHLPPAPEPSEEAQTEMRAKVMDAISRGAPMMGWDLTGADLAGMDLSRAVLKEALLEQANLAGTSLVDANLEGAVLTRANLEGARLDRANLSGANLGEVRGKGASLAGATLTKAVLERGELGEAKLAGADISGSIVMMASFPGADLSGLRAEEALFFEANFEGAKLDRASLRKATFFRCKMSGVSFVEATVEETGLVEVKADGARFDRAHAKNLRLVNTPDGKCELDGACFDGAELLLATLRGASMRKATFVGVTADGCDLSEADLREAKLDGSSLRGSRLMRSDLGRASLVGVNLIEGMLQGAKLEGAQFVRANLFRATMIGAVGDDQTSFRDAHVARTLFSRRKR